MPKKSGFSKDCQNIPPQKPFKVLLIGESCIDEYFLGDCNRISPEAPVPILDFYEKESKFGMAMNVKLNLESFGIEVFFLSNNPKKITKKRFIDQKSKHQLLRLDLGKSVSQIKIKKIFFENSYDALIISDYDKNLLPHKTLEELCSNFKGIKIVDTKKKDLSCFSNCIIKCNSDEYEKITKFGNNCEYIVTKGKNGASWNGLNFEAPQINLYDVTGAGDVFLASFSYFYIKTKNIKNSIKKAVKLSSRSVEFLGNYVLTSEDIKNV